MGGAINGTLWPGAANNMNWNRLVDGIVVTSSPFGQAASASGSAKNPYMQVRHASSCY